MKPLLIAFVGGLGLIVAVRWAAPGLDGAIFAAVLAVLVVVLLGIHHWHRREDRGRAGDELYYLGLLLTLCSLIHTLVTLFLTEARHSSERIEQLVGNFGIALVSTVAGILGRIVLQSKEPTPPTAASRLWSDEEPSDTARRRSDEGPSGTNAVRDRSSEEPSVTNAVRQAQTEALPQLPELRRQLREATDAFAHFTRVTLDHGHNVKAHTEQLAQEFNEHIEALAAKHLASTTTAWQEAATSMAAAANTMLGSIDENTASTLTRVQAAWENLAAKSNATAETARQRLAEDVEQMSALLQHLATANHALESLVASAESAHGSVAKLGDETAQAASRTGEQTVAATRALEALANGATRTQAATVQALEDTAAKTTALRESLTGTARLWQSATENFAAATGAERQRQEAIAGDARQSLDELAAGIHDVRGDVAAFGETMKIAVSALADFAATLERPNTRRRSRMGAWLAKAVRRRVPRSDPQDPAKG